MKDIFKDLLDIEGVHGVLVVSAEGKILMTKFAKDHLSEESVSSEVSWDTFVIALGDAVEAEFLYEKIRVYVRKSRTGYIVVIVDDITPISMVRLNCEILLPTIDRMKGPGRLSQILKKKIF